MAKGGLKKWFDEEWVDVKTGKKCGRSGKEKKKRPYPSCRPKAVAAKMTAAEKKSSAKRKTGPAKLNTQSQLQNVEERLQKKLDTKQKT